ncbi:MAG: ribose 5-phosphate isomerase B [Gemmataceae bacterium]|nr:ribose 5-phosphate isomerase B [Gemmataceae bacterium]
MRVALGSDHAGFPLKERLKAALREDGYTVDDLGTFSTDAVDYPDFAEKVGIAVQSRQVDRGILICGSGVGASVAANKIPGIRSAVCHDIYSCHQGVEHDDMNVLTLGARIVGESVAIELCRSFLGARYTAEDRHARRLAKINALEARHQSPH